MKPRPIFPLPQIHPLNVEVLYRSRQPLEPWTHADYQCQAWCDELRNQLKLALLFSFAVTRCLFVSSGRHQPEPKEGVVNHTSESITRVNNLLKISLLFSLISLTLSTVFLLWLQKYQLRSHYPVEHAYSLFKTRTAKLNRWNIRRGLTILPLLFRLAIVLFLGGIMDPIEMFGSACSTLIPVLGMAVFAWYIWGLTKVENTIEA